MVTNKKMVATQALPNFLFERANGQATRIQPHCGKTAPSFSFINSS
jgi:hypothetical protein